MINFIRKNITTFYNGKFVKLEDNNEEKIDVFSPINGEKIANYYFTPLDKLNEIIENANIAQKKWGNLTFKKRSEILFNYHFLLKKYRKELANLIHIDNGKTISEADAEVGKVIELTEFATSIPQLISGETQIVSKNIFAREERRSLGVVAVITPFNFPLMVPNWSIPNAIACGNAVILKASEQSPLSTSFLADIWTEAGLPEGIFNIVNGNEKISSALISHPEIKAVTFVGSTDIAKIVYDSASKNRKRVLSYGGAKNHIFSIKDAPIEATATQILSSAFGMSGQRCMAQSVMLVIDEQKKLINRMIEKMLLFKPNLTLSPIISLQMVEKLNNYVEWAKNEGAKILVNGRKVEVDKKLKNGYWFGPTLIDWSNNPDKMSEKEIFGPILEIIQVKNISEALKIQDKSKYGNATSVFTSSGRIAEQIIANSHAGMMGINIGVPVPREPFSFGGQRESKFGYGDMTGKSSINFWTKLIKVTTKWDVEEQLDWMS